MEKPKRKPNRLFEYDYSQNGAYFITICTKDKKQTLCKIISKSEIEPPLVKLSYYGHIVDKYIKSIPNLESYVIMPNHIHLIILLQNEMENEIKVQSISQRISSFKTLVTKAAGISLFQRSFHDRIIRNFKEYKKIWEYVASNPNKWKEDCFYVND